MNSQSVFILIILSFPVVWSKGTPIAPIPESLNKAYSIDEQGHFVTDIMIGLSLTDTLSGPFCGGDQNNNCEGEVYLLPDISTDCSDENITISWQLDIENDSTYNATGADALTGSLPLGHHRVSFRVNDGCDSAKIDIEFDIIDCIAPAIVCYEMVIPEIQFHEGPWRVYASEWVAFGGDSSSNCTPIQYRINRLEDLNEDGILNEEDYPLSPPDSNFIEITCSYVDACDFQNGISVLVWAIESSEDGVNDWSAHESILYIPYPIYDVCSILPFESNLEGEISTEEGDRVENVQVERLNGGASDVYITGANGQYNFSFDPYNCDVYRITPQLDDHPTNGVSTFDMILIMRHIQGVQSLNSPYKMIAADVNNSGGITTFDLVELRKLILNIETDFSNNTSWRFVDHSYEFPDLENPWAESFPELLNLFHVYENLEHMDFVAVKIGDVNGSAVTNSVEDEN